jgi:hypothetical protein
MCVKCRSFDLRSKRPGPCWGEWSIVIALAPLHVAARSLYKGPASTRNLHRCFIFYLQNERF